MSHYLLNPLVYVYFAWLTISRLLLYARQDIHFAVTDLTITAEREEAVDFTTPFMNLGITILFRKPQTPEPELLAFLLPFSSGVSIIMRYIVKHTVIFYEFRFKDGTLCGAGVAMPGAGVPGLVAGVVRGGAALPRRVAEPIPLRGGAARAGEPVHARQRAVVQPRRRAAAGLRDRARVSVAGRIVAPADGNDKRQEY